MTSLQQYRVEDYEDMYVIDSSAYGDSIEEHIERLRDKQISKYRVKTTWSGDMLEVEAYPIWAIPEGKRGKKGSNSSKAQQNLNDKNTIKRVTRIVNTNFTENDIWATWTYANGRLPADPEQAKKDMQNFIRRLKRWLKKQKKYEKFELKYIYVTEFDNSEGKKKRIHHHMVTNFPDRDVAEELWNDGGRVQTRRLKPDAFGLEGLVRYIMKDKKKNPTKRYTISRNMKQPKVSIADSKMTRRRAEKIATEEVSAQELFEKMYKGQGLSIQRHRNKIQRICQWSILICSYEANR
ncbi:hypothetical protein ACMGD3_23750 [Lysinibacillus sphaericus]|uniref:rolling circle replication-associated protein n=1 Tax=Lysinibacillus sphaericus TaxID=1421 RepID=UPI003F78C40E